MGHEASKTRNILDKYEQEILLGDGIDIGCGDDPITDRVAKFDMEDGDANEIDKYVNKEFDFVFSCHCLEHMHNPKAAFESWLKIIKPGGHLILVIPDEDLYEQGYFPSLFNSDHKSTFTLSKNKSWSPNSYNILDLVNSVKNCEILKAELQSDGYNIGKLHHGVYSRKTAVLGIKIMRKISNLFSIIRLRKQVRSLLLDIFQLPINQTTDEAMAQIFLVIKKVSN